LIKTSKVSADFPQNGPIVEQRLNNTLESTCPVIALRKRVAAATYLICT
jgi:hypothetical protein